MMNMFASPAHTVRVYYYNVNIIHSLKTAYTAEAKHERPTVMRQGKACSITQLLSLTSIV